MKFPEFFESINRPWGRDAVLFDYQDLSWTLLNQHYLKYIRNYQLESTQIPKIIHQIWLGSELPEKSVELQKRIINLHPDWDYKLWTDKDIGDFGANFEYQLNKVENLGVKSDIFRYEILAAFGGIYLDCDFYCTKSLKNLTNNVNFFAGICDPVEDNFPLINNAIFGCTIDHPLLKEISNEVKHNLVKVVNYHDQVDVFGFTGPTFFTHHILRYLSNSPTDNIVIFPSTFLYPINNRKRNQISEDMIEKNTYEETVAIHLWDASWVKTKRRTIDKFKDRLPLRYINLFQKVKALLKRLRSFVASS